MKSANAVQKKCIQKDSNQVTKNVLVSFKIVEKRKPLIRAQTYLLCHTLSNNVQKLHLVFHSWNKISSLFYFVLGTEDSAA
jgi:hypothetical protein